ncbi:MAG: putative membrane protein YwzB [Rickettsiales bacterium]|jgi:uncharacterized membrane protein YwzB
MNQAWQNFLIQYLKNSKILLLINLFIKNSKNSKIKILKSISLLSILLQQYLSSFAQRTFDINIADCEKKNDLVLFVE